MGTVKVAGKGRAKTAGREYGHDLWQEMLMNRVDDAVLAGPWIGDAKARREARRQGFAADAFAEGARAEWLRSQRYWKSDR